MLVTSSRLNVQHSIKNNIIIEMICEKEGVTNTFL